MGGPDPRLQQIRGVLRPACARQLEVEALPPDTPRPRVPSRHRGVLPRLAGAWCRCRAAAPSQVANAPRRSRWRPRAVRGRGRGGVGRGGAGGRSIAPNRGPPRRAPSLERLGASRPSICSIVSSRAERWSPWLASRSAKISAEPQCLVLLDVASGHGTVLQHLCGGRYVWEVGQVRKVAPGDLAGRPPEWVERDDRAGLLAPLQRGLQIARAEARQEKATQLRLEGGWVNGGAGRQSRWRRRRPAGRRPPCLIGYATPSPAA